MQQLLLIVIHLAIGIVGIVYVIVVYRAFNIAIVITALLRLMIVIDVVQKRRLIGFKRANFGQWNGLSRWPLLRVEP